MESSNYQEGEEDEKYGVSGHKTQTSHSDIPISQ